MTETELPLYCSCCNEGCTCDPCKCDGGKTRCRGIKNKACPKCDGLNCKLGLDCKCEKGKCVDDIKKCPKCDGANCKLGTSCKCEKGKCVDDKRCAKCDGLNCKLGLACKCEKGKCIDDANDASSSQKWVYAGLIVAVAAIAAFAVLKKKD